MRNNNQTKYHNELKGVSTRKKYNTHLGAIADNNPTAKSSTGYKGVYIKYQKYKGKVYTYYDARIQIDKKEIRLGIFYTLEEAIAARQEGVEKYYDPIVEKAIENGDFKV